MNNNYEEGMVLASEIIHMSGNELLENVDIVIAPPFIHIHSISTLAKGTRVEVAAQNCHQEESGAYTGEVAASMIHSVGAKYVIIGHSERREYFKEDDQLLAKKVDAVLKQGLIPIFCCGESLEVRESGNHESYVSAQIQHGLFHLSPDLFKKVVIAYEPIWAIGTGVTASAGQAQEMHAAIRGFISQQYGAEIADDCSLLYGGSCKPSNAKELFGLKDVDGGLIGGASLKSRDFIDIISSFPS